MTAPAAVPQEPLRILVAHNRYRQSGGEDAVFHAEVALLRAHGHRVEELFLDNREITTAQLPVLAARAVWSRPSFHLLSRTLRGGGFDVAHFHNTFPLLSPSVYSAAHRAGVAVVQTLHNYRLACPAATLLRDGRPCEDCLGRAVAWPAVLHGCYRGRAVTSVVAGMLAVHRAAGTWAREVDAYIALTEFGRRVLVRAGLPEDRVLVKPNCLSADPGEGPHDGGYALFVGRIDASKGIEPLVAAWRELGGRIPLRVAGAGPDQHLLRDLPPGVEWLGPQERGGVLELMRHASALVVPSVWYEGFPVTIAEAFATGLPVLGSRIGAIEAIVDDGVTGALFEPGSPAALAAAVRAAFADPRRLRAMGAAARQAFLERYTPEQNHRMLMEIYHAARARFAARQAAPGHARRGARTDPALR